MFLKENKDNLRTIICKILVAKLNKPDWNESWILTFSPQGQTDQFQVADGTTTARCWARTCAISNRWWCHVRLKLPSPRKRLYLKFPLTIRQRRRPWKRHWKIDFASFHTISRLSQVALLHKRREFRLELKRGDRARLQTGIVELTPLQFPFWSKLTFHHFMS